jgi:pimeloyl-ACP methyl ester carboxylesterase
MECYGTGSPTVVYFHGSIDNPGFSALTSAVPIAQLLSDRYRTCLYDRANVGRSDPRPGPITGAQTVADLHALLAAAHVPPPYVLLGASYGGLISYLYAVTYPEEVVGMVHLDGSVPDEVTKIDEVFLPPKFQLSPDEWMTSVERVSRLTVGREAEAKLGSEPAIPMIYLGITNLEIPSELPVASMTPAYRAMQQAFVDRFSPGELILLDVPHYMEPVIPDRIAAEVIRLIETLVH